MDGKKFHENMTELSGLRGGRPEGRGRQGRSEGDGGGQRSEGDGEVRRRWGRAEGREMQSQGTSVKAQTSDSAGRV